jgi:hypothetical protein
VELIRRDEADYGTDARGVTRPLTFQLSGKLAMSSTPSVNELGAKAVYISLHSVLRTPIDFLSVVVEALCYELEGRGFDSR